MKRGEMRNAGPFHEKARFGVPIFLFAVILLLASAVQAATITVTTTVDESDNSCVDGDCSLRDAVATASPGDVVAVPAGTYGLTLGNIIVFNDLTIQGAGARVTIVNGNALSRVFFIVSTVTIADLTITNGNSGPDFGTEGGGIRNFGTLTLRNCTISNNVSINGGGIFNVGTLTVDRCTLSGNTSTFDEGGGVRNPGGTATIVNSTVSGNTVLGGIGGIGFGAGISNEGDGSLSLINSTITRNTASGSGAAGGLGSNSGSVAIINTIIADNNSPVECNVSGTTVSSSHSLASDNTCPLAGTGDLPNTSPGLDPLANNGGPTDTHALQASSAAVDAGDDATCVAAPVNGIDQRGTGRPQGSHCDIGAFELQNQPPVCTGANPSVAKLWPPNHKFVQVSVQGVTDPDGDPVTIVISKIRQDELTQGLGDGNTCPDGKDIGTATASVRAERSALGNGRVYTISFTASDGNGGSCQGSVKVCVPHDHNDSCVDGGPSVDSTVCDKSLGSAQNSSSAFAGDDKLGFLCASHLPTLDCDLFCDAGILLCQ